MSLDCSSNYRSSEVYYPKRSSAEARTHAANSATTAPETDDTSAENPAKKAMIDVSVDLNPSIESVSCEDAEQLEVREFEFKNPYTASKLIKDVVKKIDDEISMKSSNKVSLEDYEALYSRLLGRQDKLKGYHMKLAQGIIWIYKVPTVVHEVVSDVFVGHIVRYNISISQLDDDPLLGRGSTKFTFLDSSIEPDNCYCNDRIPLQNRHNDLRTVFLPNVVVEVGYSESYESLFSTPRTYFSRPGVQAVIVVWLSYKRGLPRKIRQMVAVLYRRNGVINEVPIPSIAISFGAYLHPLTSACILHHSRVSEGNLGVWED